MPIISATLLEKQTYRITLSMGHNNIVNVVVTSDGLYSVVYIKNGTVITSTGKILNVVNNTKNPQNSYILFDWSEDNDNKRERINFYQIQDITDVTPNNAYQIALEHGFVGTVEDWLESLRGPAGESAYEIAVRCGFEGTESEWLESLRGERGYSMYDLAVKYGYEGTEEQWFIDHTDTVTIANKLDKVSEAIQWKETMDA